VVIASTPDAPGPPGLKKIVPFLTPVAGTFTARRVTVLPFGLE
jgi:hypothetical protein